MTDWSAIAQNARLMLCFGGLAAKNGHIVAGGGAGAAEAGLPDALPAGGWTVLLPAVAGVALRPGDAVRDEAGRLGVIAQAELSELAWRGDSSAGRVLPWAAKVIPSLSSQKFPPPSSQ
jgi:hypothetical protein